MKNLIPFLFIGLLCFGSLYGQTNTDPPAWKHIVVISKSVGFNATGFKVKYIRNTKFTWNGWLIPAGFGFNRSTINSDHFIDSGYYEADINTFSYGYTGFKKVIDNIYLNIGLNVTAGSERLISLKDTREERFILGTSPTQTVFYIPNNKLGLVIGIGLYEKVQTSKVYSFDIGALISVGFRI